MSVEIISYEDRYWDSLRQFINNHWKENHPICRKQLFDWQYRFGVACKLAVENNDIIGFIGAIPGKYMIDGEIIKGVALAIWIVAEKYRNSGLGILLLDAVEKENDCVICLGVNENVVKFYRMRNYKYLSALNRYVIPLDIRLYKELVGDSWKIDLGDVLPISPEDITASRAYRIWQNFIARNNSTNKTKIRFTLYRDSDFRNWRYIKSAGFKYLLFANNENFLVGRFDEITGAKQKILNGKKVFRIIELFSFDRAFVKGVLTWAEQQGAILADFQISSRLFDEMLIAVGFKYVELENPATNIPAIFTPIRYDIPPINIVMRILDFNDRDISFDETYFVKSDGDMDRPIN